MTKEVLVTISGLQMSTDSEEDSMELIIPGEYYYRNDKHYILYEESIEGHAEKTKNVIKFTDDYMEVTKKGPMSVHMVFEKSKKNVTYYYTPFGSLHIGIDAKKFDYILEEDNIHLDVKYALDINFEKVADCNIVVDVKPRNTKDFKLVK